MKEQKRIHIGTSGWSYRHWRGPFYPIDESNTELLDFYARRFKTVEINNCFYQLPSESTLTRWRETTPDDFCFAVKASRFITHMKKLKDPEQTVPTFIERLEVLGNKLGPVLFQLPPHWGCNADRLERFLAALSNRHRYAFEFRDPSWHNPRVYELLERQRAAFCIFDLNGQLSPKRITADLVYVRLHGPNGPYRGQYDTPTLAGWAETFSTWSSQGKDVYCYFDNDEAGYAVLDAGRLQDMLLPSTNIARSGCPKTV